MASLSQPERLLFAEPFLAWRAWGVTWLDGEPRLESLIYKHVWQPRVHLEAECLKAPGPSPHPVPDEECRCGVYGSTDTSHLRGYIQETQKNHPHGPPSVVASTKRVFGLVALWGVVVECNQGFRAQKAYPRSLYLPCEMHKHAEGLEAYGVPVHCVDEAHGFEALLKVVRQVRAQETDSGGSSL